MSARRGWTVSPLTGCPANASPSAFQSFSVPVSKSRLSGLPSAPLGRTPSGGVAGGLAQATGPGGTAHRPAGEDVQTIDPGATAAAQAPGRAVAPGRGGVIRT